MQRHHIVNQRGVRNARRRGALADERQVERRPRSVPRVRTSSMREARRVDGHVAGRYKHPRRHGHTRRFALVAPTIAATLTAAIAATLTAAIAVAGPSTACSSGEVPCPLCPALRRAGRVPCALRNCVLARPTPGPRARRATDAMAPRQHLERAHALIHLHEGELHLEGGRLARPETASNE